MCHLAIWGGGSNCKGYFHSVDLLIELSDRMSSFSMHLKTVDVAVPGLDK